MTPSDWYFLWRSPIVRLQWLIFDVVWPITILAVGVFAYWATRTATDTSLSSGGMQIAIAVGGVIGFLHKHTLDCERESLRLFQQYNEKFAALQITQDKLLSEPALVEKYLDLCSEEYILFLQGRIHPTIWRSWASGMLTYLILEDAKNKLGNGERYYGLTIGRIS